MKSTSNVSRSSSERLVDAFNRRGGILTRGDIAALGFGADTIAKILAAGIAVRVAHGIYRLADVLPFGNAAYAQACLAIPSGVIALETALAYHGLTTQIVDVVQLGVPRVVSRKRMEIPLKVVAMPASRFVNGVIRERTDEGDRFRVFSPARTICDCFAYPRLVPESVAYEGLRTYLESDICDPEELMREAAFTRTVDFVAPVVKAMSA